MSEEETREPIEELINNVEEPVSLLTKTLKTKLKKKNLNLKRSQIQNPEPNQTIKPSRTS